MKLKDGTEEADTNVRALMLTLNALLDEEPLALYDLRTMIDDVTYRPFGNNEEILKRYHLLQPDGRIHATIRNIVRNAVIVDGIDIKVGSPA